MRVGHRRDEAMWSALPATGIQISGPPRSPLPGGYEAGLHITLPHLLVCTQSHTHTGHTLKTNAHLDMMYYSSELEQTGSTAQIYSLPRVISDTNQCDSHLRCDSRDVCLSSLYATK